MKPSPLFFDGRISTGVVCFLKARLTYVDFPVNFIVIFLNENMTPYTSFASSSNDISPPLADTPPIPTVCCCCVWPLGPCPIELFGLLLVSDDEVSSRIGSGVGVKLSRVDVMAAEWEGGLLFQEVKNTQVQCRSNIYRLYLDFIYLSVCH